MFEVVAKPVLIRQPTAVLMGPTDTPGAWVVTSLGICVAFNKCSRDNVMVTLAEKGLLYDFNTQEMAALEVFVGNHNCSTLYLAYFSSVYDFTGLELEMFAVCESMPAIVMPAKAHEEVIDVSLAMPDTGQTSAWPRLKGDKTAWAKLWSGWCGLSPRCFA